MLIIPPTEFRRRKKPAKRRTAPPQLPPTLVVSVTVGFYPNPTTATWQFDHPIEWDGVTVPDLVVENFPCWGVLDFNGPAGWIVMEGAGSPDPGSQWSINAPVVGISSPGRQIVVPQSGTIATNPPS